VKQLAGKPFALLGVHGFDYPAAKLKAVMDKEKLNWRSLSSRAIAVKWSARGTPTYYVIDPKGVIRYKWSGYPGANAIDAALEKMIKEAEADKKEDKKGTQQERGQV
jgi:thioredoxin-related protein